MSPAYVIFCIFGLGFITFWLGLYVYSLYHLGRHIARNFKARFRPIPMCVAITLIPMPVAALAFLLPMHFIVNGCLFFGFWLLHSHPVIVGFWAGVEIERKQDIERWSQQAEEWIRDWEHKQPHGLDEEEGS